MVNCVPFSGRPRHEANQSSLCNVEVKKAWKYTATSPVCFHCCTEKLIQFISQVVST